MDNQHLEHDLFLLLLNLSQVNGEEHTKKLFIDSLNSLSEHFQLHFIERKNEAKGEVIAVETSQNSFGFVDVQYTPKEIEESTHALIRNSIKMLAIFLEKQLNEKLLDDEKLLLNNLVAKQTQKLKAANKEMKREIEERKKIAYELGEKKFFIQRILDTTPNLIYIYDLLEQKNIFSNREIAIFLGYNEKQIQTFGSKIMEKIIHPEDMTIVKKHHEKLKTAPDNQILELFYRIKHKNGSWRWLHSRDLPFSKSPDGTVKRILGIAEDVTEKKKSESLKIKLEKQLNQAQKIDAIGILAGGIAHDFNNMLGVITGNISYAQSMLNKEDELFEILSDVQKSTKQAQSLTKQLLTFSKGGSPVKKLLDINSLLKDSATFSTRGAMTNCNFELFNGLWPAEIDEGQIHQVIGNLIINANQAMPNGGTITIRTDNINIGMESGLPLSPGKYIKIVIEDQGIGISKKHLQNIFDPYFTTKQKGSGLGLSTTYSIIKSHNGHISVDSEIEKGTVFNIYLPASTKIIENIEDKEAIKLKGQGKILIMDDQEPILKMVGRLLERMGYETFSALNGSEAINIYNEAQSSGNPFDLIILDLTIPGGMGGLKTIIELLKINPNVKAVASSGYSNDPIMANYEDYGFCGIVPKPYTKNELAEVLNKVLGNSD